MSGFKYVEDPILGKGRAEFIGGGTGGESYVAGEGIAINGNTISATGGGGDVTEAEFKDLSDGTQSVTKDLENARYIIAGGSPKTNSLTLLHFSDIHADSSALTRIMADRTAFGALVNDVICTGDMVEQTAGQIASWWNPAVMTCIGNHDCYVNGDWNGLSMANRIAYYISPFESNWGITRGENQDWWYKDYNTQKVRLIAIDCQWYRNPTGTEATTQTAWITSLLADAITQGLHVLIATHSRNNASIQCFTSFNRFGEYSGYNTTICETPQVIIDAVASAINSGLKFVGYIAGHYHQDDIWDATGDGTQYVYAITLASTAASRNISDQYRVDTDAYNLIAIDTNNTLIKITRGGGANIDNMGRPRQTITINYSTGEIIDTQRPKDGERLETKDGVQNVKRYIETKEVSGSSVTLQAGYGYKFTATGEVTLELEYVPGNNYGLESVLDVTLAGGTITAGTNVILGDALTDSARNVCSVKYIDGIAVVNVLAVVNEIPVGAYVVTSATGTSDGSLYYGLATSEKDTIYVSPALVGQTIDLGGAVTNGAKEVHGSGFSVTTISGNVSCTSTTTFTALSMNDVYIVGGTATLDGVKITSGGAVYPTGNGSIIPLDIQGGEINLVSATAESPVMCIGSTLTANLSGVAIHDAPNNTAINLSGCAAALNNCLITNCSAGKAGYVQNGGTAVVTGTTFTQLNNSSTSTKGGAAYIAGGANVTFDGCVFSGNNCSLGTDVAIDSGSALLSSCLFDGASAQNGSILLGGAGAIVTMTGSTMTNISGHNNGIVIYAGTLTISNSLISGCSAATTNGVLFNVVSATSVSILGSTITNNKAGNDDILFGSNTKAFVSNSIISGNITSYGLGVKQGASCTFEGCTLGPTIPYNGGCVVFTGSNNVERVYTTNSTGVSCIISSGASINLTTSIGIGANGITVLTGGCVVNGAAIAAGTYTQIVSSGGSAVAS